MYIYLNIVAWEFPKNIYIGSDRQGLWRKTWEISKKLGQAAGGKDFLGEPKT